jgi:sucrose-6-phosphate hydrolase SacC (GH32 family)
MIGWMNNWDYANQIPTSPWRSPMSLAREISLHDNGGDLRLVQQPVGDWAGVALPSKSFSLTETVISGLQILDGAAGTVQRINVTFTPGSAEEFGLVVRGDGAEGTRIGILPAEGSLIVDRRASGLTDFHKAFPSIDTAPIRAAEGTYHLMIYVDRCSVEIFAEGGQVTMTELIFPAASSTAVAVYASGGTATVNRLEVDQLA